MATYKVTPVETPDLETFSNFDDLLRNDLSRDEVKKILEFLRPYFDDDNFKEGDALEFRYFPSVDLDADDYDEEDEKPHKFVIYKDKK